MKNTVIHVAPGKAFGSSMTTVFVRFRSWSGVPGDCGIVEGRDSDLDAAVANGD